MGVKRVRIAMMAAAAFAITMSACARHNDFPTQINVQYPPPIENLDVATQDNVAFDLTWSVSAPSIVAYYNVYTVNPFSGVPEFADSTSTTAVTVNTGGVPLPGLTFGVSSVSTENVESGLSFASADN